MAFTIGHKNNNANANGVFFIPDASIDKVIKDLTAKYGETQKTRITKGVNQVAALWVSKDGKVEDFEKFCTDKFIDTDKDLETAFNTLQHNFEILWGSYNKMTLELKSPLDLDRGTISDIDMMFGSYDLSAHLTEDFFENKIAFLVMLNFPAYTLKEKIELGVNWTRKQWAYVRMGDVFTQRIPAWLNLKFTETLTAADSYISDYNIYLGNLVNDKNETLFPKELKLITHWGLRDEIKANYSDTKKGLEKQRMIYEVMKKIISQEIPKDVINSNVYTWNPIKNKMFKDGKETAFTPEPDTRYEVLLSNFNVQQQIDIYCPKTPTYIQRKFDSEMEIPQEDIEKLFIGFISSQQVKKVADLISKRLKRKLEPFDIWYDGFKSRSTISADSLDAMTTSKYKTRDDVQNDLPNILTKLGFSSDKAKFITSKVTVDPSRGAGHAAGSAMKGDNAHLRTRIGAKGMDYKGYNIAVHEFGHNVEQTLSLYNVDYYMLNGVPNTAFTEALAFVFQKRDLDLLGVKNDDPNKQHLIALDNFWSAYEIMGVSLVDQYVWKWMYANPKATAKQLKEQLIVIAKDVWNKYYAPVFGSKDQTILGIYSHMIDYPLYLSAYPVGHLIEFQIDQQLEGKNFGDEVERIYTYGRIIPQLWMKHAVGKEISTQPMIDATEEALKYVK